MRPAPGPDGLPPGPPPPGDRAGHPGPPAGWTLADAMDDAVRRHGDREAYVDGDRRITFAAWIRDADALAAEFADRGVRPGDVVALMLPSSIDYALCFAAAARLGAVATGINTRLGPREVDAILGRCRPALVVRDAGAGVPSVPAGTPVFARAHIAAACRRRGLGEDRPRVAPEDPAVIIWTSGTTGVPKGAWFDHRNLAAAVASAGVLNATHDRRLVATPFAHAGYMAKLWDQLHTGSTLVVGPAPWSAAEMLRILVDERITVAGAVPPQWTKLLELPETRGGVASRLPHLRIGVAATAPAPPELVERVGRVLGCPLVVRYAMTESPSITGTEPGDPPHIGFRTVGRAQAGVAIEVRGDDGTPLAPGETGTVHVRGACVMRGYWNDPARTRAVLAPDGTLATGDLGRLAPDGNLELVGRAGDMYIRGGYNVHPLEVENVLAEHPGVDRVAVAGRPTPVIGEIGVAFVVPTTPEAPPTLGELRDFAAARLADYKAPDRVEIVGDLPLTAMLKIDRHEVRARAAALPADPDRPRHRSRG